MGLFPGGGATQRLPRLVGVPNAKNIIFTGEPVEAEEALRIGLVDRVVSPGEVLDAALAWAAKLAAGPAAARGQAKRAIDGGIGLSLAGLPGFRHYSCMTSSRSSTVSTRCSGHATTYANFDQVIALLAQAVSPRDLRRSPRGPSGRADELAAFVDRDGPERSVAGRVVIEGDPVDHRSGQGDEAP
jgi:hypothetical protein